MKFDIKMLRKPTAEEKFPPQVLVVLGAIQSKVGVGKTIDREDLIKELDAANKADGDASPTNLKTKQGAGRILTFYLPRLVKAGIVEVTKTAPEKPAPAEKKPGGKKGEPTQASA